MCLYSRMATRTNSWFDAEKLLYRERMVRSGRVRLRTSAPPYWWEGSLILTSDRLFFLPDVDSPLIDPVAFWLAEVTHVTSDGPRRLRVDGAGSKATFLALGLAGRSHHAWLRAIASVREGARPRSAFETPRRRAAG